MSRPRRWNSFDGGMGDAVQGSVVFTNLANAQATLNALRRSRSLRKVSHLVAGDELWSSDMNALGLNWRKVARQLDRTIARAKADGLRHVAWYTAEGGYPWEPAPSIFDPRALKTGR